MDSFIKMLYIDSLECKYIRQASSVSIRMGHKSLYNVLKVKSHKNNPTTPSLHKKKALFNAVCSLKVS